MEQYAWLRLWVLLFVSWGVLLTPAYAEAVASVQDEPARHARGQHARVYDSPGLPRRCVDVLRTQHCASGAGDERSRRRGFARNSVSHYEPVRIVGQANNVTCTLSTARHIADDDDDDPGRRQRTAHILIGLPEADLQEPLHPRPALYFRNMTHSYRSWHTEELPRRSHAYHPCGSSNGTVHDNGNEDEDGSLHDYHVDGSYHIHGADGGATGANRRSGRMRYIVPAYDTAVRHSTMRHRTSSTGRHAVMRWLHDVAEGWMHTLRQVRHSVVHYAWYRLTALLRLLCQRHVTIGFVVDTWSDEKQQQQQQQFVSATEPPRDTMSVANSSVSSSAVLRRRARANRLAAMEMLRVVVYPPSPRVCAAPAHDAAQKRRTIADYPEENHRHDNLVGSDGSRATDINSNSASNSSKSNVAGDTSIQSDKNQPAEFVPRRTNVNPHEDDEVCHRPSRRVREKVYLTCDYSVIHTARQHLREGDNDDEEEEEEDTDTDDTDRRADPSHARTMRDAEYDVDEAYEQRGVDMDADHTSHTPRRRGARVGDAGAWSASWRSRLRDGLLVAVGLRSRARLSSPAMGRRDGGGDDDDDDDGNAYADEGGSRVRWSDSQRAAERALREYVHEELGPYQPTHVSLVSPFVRYVLGRRLYDARYHVTETTTTTTTTTRRRRRTNWTTAAPHDDGAESDDVSWAAAACDGSGATSAPETCDTRVRHTTEWRLSYEMTLPATRSLCLALQALPPPPPPPRRVVRLSRSATTPSAARRMPYQSSSRDMEHKRDDRLGLEDAAGRDGNRGVEHILGRDHDRTSDDTRGIGEDVLLLRVTEELRLDTFWCRLALLALLLSFLRPYIEYSTAMHVLVAASGGVLLLFTLLLLYTLRELRRMTIGRAGLFLVLAFGGVTAVLEGVLSALAHTVQQQGGGGGGGGSGSRNSMSFRLWGLLDSAPHTGYSDWLWVLALLLLVLGSVGMWVVRWLVPASVMQPAMHRMYGTVLLLVRMAMWVVNREATALLWALWGMMWVSRRWLTANGSRRQEEEEEEEEGWRRQSDDMSCTRRASPPVAADSPSRDAMHGRVHCSVVTDKDVKDGAMHAHRCRGDGSGGCGRRDYVLPARPSWLAALFRFQSDSTSARGGSSSSNSSSSSRRSSAHLSGAAATTLAMEALHDPAPTLPAVARHARGFVRPLTLEGQFLGAASMTRAARLREYERSGAQYTRRALEQLARHVRECPGLYATRLHDPNSLQRWAGAPEESGSSSAEDESSSE